MNLTQLAIALDSIDCVSFYECNGKLCVRGDESLTQLSSEQVKQFANELNMAILPVKEDLFEEVRKRFLDQVIKAEVR